MKKIFAVAILFSVLAVVAAPAVLAADTPIQCCKIKRDVKVDDTLATKGQTVGSPDETACPLANKAGTENAAPDVKTEKWGAFCLLNTINTVVDWVFAFLVIIAVFYVILGAWNILTSAGDPSKVSAGRNYILYAAIGLLVGFIARAIPNLVKSIMGF